MQENGKKLSLLLFGGFEARSSTGLRLDLRSRKAQGLLAFLALNRHRGHSREQLATLLWKRSGPDQSRVSLRQSLTRLRKALLPLGDEILIAERDQVSLVPEIVELDVEEFASSFEQGTVEALERANALYQGELLAGVDLISEPYEEWLKDERQRLQALAEATVERLLAHYRYSGANEHAVRVAKRLVDLNPLREDAQRTLMRLYATSGHRALALKQYDQMRETLRREIGAEPDLETRNLAGSLAGPYGRRPAVSVPVQTAPPSPKPGPDTRARQGGGLSPNNDLFGDTSAKGPLFVGREAELRQLQDHYEEALRGRRQIVFVSGEAGIGKSTLVEAWLQQSLSQHAEILVGRGQCVEHSGAGEAYLPLLEALDRLCRGPWGETVIAHLRQQAPGWLAQLSGVLPIPARDLLQQQPPIDSYHYQLELADALEALGKSRPLLLIAEDLQWSDQATVEALTMLARRPEAAQLLVIGTYRSPELLAQEHPRKSLAHELSWHRHCCELALSDLDEAAVRNYVSQRLPPETAGKVVDMVYRRTAGQPLFMVELTEYLAQHPDLITVPGAESHRESVAAPDATGTPNAAVVLPAGLRQFIEVQIARLGEVEQRVLEAASAVGLVFVIALVAALGISEGDVEQICEGLSRRQQLIRTQGLVEWPDGTLSESFTFRHGLYQEVFYQRIGNNRRIRLHRAIGDRLEAAHGTNASSIAFELAEHFERGRDYRRAVRYHRLAAETTLKRYAPQAAHAHLNRGLDLLSRLPQDAERSHEELYLQISRASALIATEGFGAPSVASAYQRAHALSRQLPNTPNLLPVVNGLWNYFVSRADFRQARKLAKELSAQIDSGAGRDSVLPAHNAVGQTYLFMGLPTHALEHIEAVLASNDGVEHQALYAQYGEDPIVVANMYAALVDWLVGYPDRAKQRIEAGLKLARELAQPFGIAEICWAGAFLDQSRGDPAGTRAQAEGLIDLCEQEGIALWRAGGHILRGWALTQQGQPVEGIASIRQGLEDWDGTGSVLIRPYYLALLAEALGRAGAVADGLEVATEALATARRTGERWYEAELHRLQATLRFSQGDDGIDEAEVGLRRALKLAQQQQIRSLELRAATSLAHLWLGQGKQQDAKELLTPVYDSFTEGFETKDVNRAGRLLKALSIASGAA